MPGKENNAQNNACAEAILACFEALYRTAFRLTGNKAQAEDLVQETYLRAWRSLSRLHGLSSVQPWMFRILRTVFIDQLRRESRRPKLVTDVGKMLAASERLSPPEVSDVKDRRNLDGVFDQEILSAMSELPDEERLARQNRLFWDQKGGAYFTTSGKDPNLLLKTKGDFDGAEPSPNSVSALNLTRLSWFFDNKDWARMAEKTINAFRIQLSRSPSSLPQMLVALDASASSPRQVVIAGKPHALDTQALLQEVNKRYQPNEISILVDGGPGQEYFTHKIEFFKDVHPIDEKATAYVCENFVCQLPTSDPAVVARLLDNSKSLPTDNRAKQDADKR